MKTRCIWIAALGILLGILGTQIACDKTTAIGPTGSGSTTIMVSTASSSLSSSTYIYTSPSGSNGTGGVLSLTAHVGNVIVLPGSGFHPLYFDHGSSTCIYTAASAPQTYNFSSTGTYYFHCGNHVSGCSGGNTACGSTNCSAMAGVVTVN